MANKSTSINSTNQHIAREAQQPGKGKLFCGARYCHRCHEECGVVVNAYILRDLMNEKESE